MSEQPKKQVRTPSPHHRIVYANQVGSTTSPTDIRLRFGVLEVASESEVRVEDQVDVMLSPVLAKQLMDLLDRVLKKHFQIVEMPVGADASAQETK